MQLGQLAALHVVMLMCVIFTETSGGQTCWFRKKTRRGEECRGKMRRLNAAIARYLGGTTEEWACTLHWNRANREANRFCACPLPVHSSEIHPHNIPERFLQMFDRIGRLMSGYRPGLRWCGRCRNQADEVFKGEKDYLPPEQVSLH